MVVKREFCVYIKKVGKFYNAYYDDGIVLHEIMEYRYSELRRATGFPISVIDKVKLKLESENVGYVIYDKEGITDEYIGVNAKYSEYLKKGLKNIKIEQRANRLKKIIDECSKEELELIFEGLENGCFKQG